MTKASTKRKIHVYTDWVNINGTKYMGILHTELLRGKEIFSFEFDKKMVAIWSSAFG